MIAKRAVVSLRCLLVPCLGNGRALGRFKVWRPATRYVWGRNVAACAGCVREFWTRGYSLARETEAA